MPYIEDLVQSIDGRVRALNGEIASLEEARAALISNGSAPARSPQLRPRQGRRPKASKTPKRTKATEVLLADQAERLLASTNGLTTAGLAKQAGAERDQVLALLRDLEKARRVRRTGQRRTTRWHAITDEDRIRDRAAELASRRRPKQDDQGTRRSP
jgi:hypothetical protein